MYRLDIQPTLFLKMSRVSFNMRWVVVIDGASVSLRMTSLSTSNSTTLLRMVGLSLSAVDVDSGTQYPAHVRRFDIRKRDVFFLQPAAEVSA